MDRGNDDGGEHRLSPQESLCQERKMVGGTLKHPYRLHKLCSSSFITTLWVHSNGVPRANFGTEVPVLCSTLHSSFLDLSLDRFYLRSRGYPFASEKR